MIPCDSHSSARAKAKFSLDAGGTLYACGHCAVIWDIKMKAQGIDYLATRLDDSEHAKV